MIERVNHMILILRESRTRCPEWIRSASPATLRAAAIGVCAVFWLSVILYATL
jgi:hypothetical protein